MDKSLWIEGIGWLGSILILGSYALNMQKKLNADSKIYIWANMMGGACFVLHTYVHGAHPSMFVNIVWVMIALFSLMRK
jgi:hypothetical protein